MSLSVQPGGSLLVAWQLTDRPVLLVGAGEIAAQRLAALLSADALITLVAPSPVHPVISANLSEYSHRITHHDRPFEPTDLDTFNPIFVLTAISDPAASRAISAECRARCIPINVADDPPACDFFFGAIVRKGPLQILISTNGNGPRLASLIKERIEDALPDNVGQTIERVGLLRQKLRQRVPDIGGTLGRRRMRWISRVCETWSFDHLAQLDDLTITRLLDEGWEKDTVPTPVDILGKSRGFSLGLSSVNSFTVGFTSGFVTALAFALLFHHRTRLA